MNAPCCSDLVGTVDDESGGVDHKAEARGVCMCDMDDLVLPIATWRWMSGSCKADQEERKRSFTQVLSMKHANLQGNREVAMRIY